MKIISEMTTEEFEKEIKEHFSKPKIMAPSHWFTGDLTWAKEFLKERGYISKNILL